MAPAPHTPSPADEDLVRYAVVGLGWFAQAAILPAFENARENSRLVALVSGDDEKLQELGERYGVPPERRVGYDRYDELLASGEVDAVYIALPNHLHREYTVRAAEAGVGALCEKPMAVTEEECRAMIDACRENDVKLMIAYRLHFEPANLRAAELVREGRLGDPRLYSAVFGNRVTDEDDIRLNPIEEGGGTVYDIGIYCINAARNLFRSEPEAVAAFSARGDDPRFRDCDETTTVMLRFPGARLATFVSSFGAADRDGYRIVGTEGDLLVEPAFQFRATLKHRLTVGDETTEEEFPERDQVAPELLHFSRCILEDEDPEPSGLHGLADVRIIQAVYRSARDGGRPIPLEPVTPERYPDASQEDYRPALGEQDLVHESAP
jgi:glucose-fructose oxidoreductase